MVEKLIRDDAIHRIAVEVLIVDMREVEGEKMIRGLTYLGRLIKIKLKDLSSR